MISVDHAVVLVMRPMASQTIIIQFYELKNMFFSKCDFGQHETCETLSAVLFWMCVTLCGQTRHKISQISQDLTASFQYYDRDGSRPAMFETAISWKFPQMAR
jgi:hypothetical protein